MTLSVPQLNLLRSLKSQGFSTHFKGIFLARCGASEQDWQELEREGWLQEQHGRYELTEQGRKGFEKGKKGRYF